MTCLRGRHTRSPHSLLPYAAFLHALRVNLLLPAIRCGCCYASVFLHHLQLPTPARTHARPPRRPAFTPLPCLRISPSIAAPPRACSSTSCLLSHATHLASVSLLPLPSPTTHHPAYSPPPTHLPHLPIPSALSPTTFSLRWGGRRTGRLVKAGDGSGWVGVRILWMVGSILMGCAVDGGRKA